jgi:hypothetical protein
MTSKTKTQKPLNHNDLIGRPNLYANTPIYKLANSNGARIQFNILNGCYMVDGQRDSPIMYSFKSISMAIRLAKTIDHYNSTGDKKIFKTGDVSELIENFK